MSLDMKDMISFVYAIKEEILLLVGRLGEALQYPLQTPDDTFMLLDDATQKRMCLIILTESVAVLFKMQNIFSKSFSDVQDLFKTFVLRMTN